MLTYC